MESTIFLNTWWTTEENIYNRGGEQIQTLDKGSDRDKEARGWIMNRDELDSINWLTFLMNSLESLDQNPQEKELATLPWQQVAVLPVLNASSSSSVEKDGSLHRNIHSKLIFFVYWISTMNLMT